MISTSPLKLGQPNDAEEKQRTESDLFESSAARIEILHEEKLKYVDSQNETNIVLIQMTQSNNKKKWIFLIIRLPFAEHKFAKIFVPDDAYSVVKAMDELMNKNLEKPPDFPIFVRVSGIRYDYGLGIRSNPNQNDDQLIFKSITTAVDPWHKPKQIYMSIRLFPLLRDIMAKMLKEFDGTKQIGQLPSPLPKWILQSEEDSNQQNVMKTSKEEEQLETIRQEKLDFTANTFSGKFDRQIIIELRRNKQGEEFIQIVQKFGKLESSKDIGEDSKKFFPPIPITDAYRLPDAMQSLSNDLQEKCPGFRIPENIPPKNSICRQIIKGGLLYDYKLAICICPLSNQLDFTLKTITTGANKLHISEKLYGPTPLDVFNWLKEQMAELLRSSSNQQEQKTCQIQPLEFKEVNGKEPVAYKEKDNKILERLIRLEAEFYWVEAESQARLIKIEFTQGKSGQKFINIVQRFIEKDGGFHYVHFPYILVPEDAYRFLDAMRAMSNELQEKRADPFIGMNKKSSMICQQMVKGVNYDYKMELHSLQNQQLDFRLKTMPNKIYKWHKPKELLGPIPIDIFTWMMEQIAEILEDYNENEEKR